MADGPDAACTILAGRLLPRNGSGYLLISDLLGSILPYQIALGHYLVLSGLDRATIRTY